MHARLIALASLLFACPAIGDSPGACLVEKARQQVGVTVSYDPAYRRIEFPGGDVPLDRGV